MRPSLTEPLTDPVTSPATINKKLFPDGLKTSGQHDPIYSLLHPYEDFPTQITGPTVWKAEDYRDHPERWTHVFSEEEIQELSKAADDFIASGIGLTGISKVRLVPPYPSLPPLL